MWSAAEQYFISDSYKIILERLSLWLILQEVKKESIRGNQWMLSDYNWLVMVPLDIENTTRAIALILPQLTCQNMQSIWTLKIKITRTNGSYSSCHQNETLYLRNAQSGLGGMWDHLPLCQLTRGRKRAEVRNICFLGHDDQPLESIRQSSGSRPQDPGTSNMNRFTENNAHNCLDCFLLWSHIAPPASDMLSWFPVTDEEYFKTDEMPHVFFAGNQKHFKLACGMGHAFYITVSSLSFVSIRRWEWW